MEDGRIWCGVDRVWVDRKKLREVNIRGTVRYLCPECGIDLLPPKNPERKGGLLRPA